jgi:nucleoside-diphosphate-sugar epimerase
MFLVTRPRSARTRSLNNVSEQCVCYRERMAARGARTLFITGATGFVGGAVARRAVAAGYRVAGLARSEKAAEQLARVSVIARRGDLSDLASLAVAIDGADVIVHCAFARDAYDRLDAAVETEVAATTFLVKSCARGGVRFLYTSGIGVVGPTGPRPRRRARSGAYARGDEVAT